MVAAKEISLALPGALRLAGKAWGSPTQSNLRVLAVHGWMDNANSFDRLGPALASASNAHVVAIDLLGHGNSDHAPSPSGTYHASEHIAATAAALDALGWLDGESPADGPVLLGHSMGGGICTLLAAAYADRVRALALCEGLGPLARPADGAPANLRKALDALRPAADAPSRGRCLSSVDAAARARVMGARKPGRPQRLSAGAALRIAGARRRRRGALRPRPRARAAAADVHRRGDVAELLPRDRVPGARGAGRRRLAAPRAGLHHAVRGARRSPHAR